MRKFAPHCSFVYKPNISEKGEGKGKKAISRTILLGKGRRSQNPAAASTISITLSSPTKKGRRKGKVGKVCLGKFLPIFFKRPKGERA